MKFASERVRHEWDSPNLHPMAREIANEAGLHARMLYEWEFVLTSIFRTHEEDRALDASGVHPAWRAVDVRTRDVPPEQATSIGEWINANWQYDPARPKMQCCVYKPHGTGPHLHVQVHANTRRAVAPRLA